MDKIDQTYLEMTLRQFVVDVREGRTPTSEALNLVADGIAEYVENGKAYWPVKTKLLTKGMINAQRAFVLKESGITRHRTAEIMELTDEKGTDYERKHRQWIENADGFLAKRANTALEHGGPRAAVHAGGLVLYHWYQDVLATYAEALTDSEVAQIEDAMSWTDYTPEYEARMRELFGDQFGSIGNDSGIGGMGDFADLTQHFKPEKN